MVDIDQNSVTTDPAALRDKQKVMRVTHYNSLFFSIADTMKTVASVLTPVGLAVVVSSVVQSMQTMTAIEAFAAIPPVTLTIAAIAVAATVAAVGFSYIASRYYHSGNFDALEVNAKHTAKYIAKELKIEAACVQDMEHAQNARADGKQWTQVVNKPAEPSVTSQPTR